MAGTCVIIHGHFYQPPRENPFTGVIERQESAAPFHDWNERITAECYTPNTRSKVLDGKGRVVDRVNNFEHMSFNFGPTLLSYLQEHHAETYRRILEADSKSVAARGHGNAMAQCYNHMIMPLASGRDRWTQIVWGVEDFRFRFRRDPEGMWLPETAVHPATLDDLIRAGMRFVILSPTQAQRIRPPGSSEWKDVSKEGAPTGQPYLCRTAQGNLAILFYHPGLSQGVAFRHLLTNATTFADQIAQQGRLVMVCNDGESYGHHEPYGDMCMAYLATRELPARGMPLTNPAAFLADHPPEWEVQLQPGKNGLGTSWSCVHGVERWRADCGCKTGGDEGWNQAWREPLRAGFDRLRQRLDPLFQRMGSGCLKDPWKARDDYIHLLLDDSEDTARAFFERHARGPISADARARIHMLLEMQHFAMLMYTSCGWFFSDLSGLETIQNICYALRAAQLGAKLAGEPVDRELREELKKARSNRPEIGTALDILEKQIEPAALATPIE
jgi:alpha-amylase/alpha-mannosidase (GH57 family)